MAIAREIHNLSDLEPTLRRLRTFPREMLKEATKAMQISVNEFEGAVVERTPVGATEILRGSIFGEAVNVTGEEVVGHVGSPEIYALPVEEGTKPHWPPRGALLQWVERVLGIAGAQAERVEFLVRRAISRRGTKGAHMFREGWKASEDRIRRVWRRLGFELIRKHFR